MTSSSIRNLIPLLLVTVFGVFLTVWITAPEKAPWAGMTYSSVMNKTVIALLLLVMALALTYATARLAIRNTPHEVAGVWRSFWAPEASASSESPNKPIEKIESMIGLHSVKREINSLISRLQIEQQRRLQNFSVTATSQHMVFTGPPGVGKTEIARQLGAVYRTLGVLDKGHLVEVDRSDLVAGYVGQTAERTLAVCKRALDGVLFIDEAYSLVDGGDGGFGKEAVEVLLKFMEDHRSRIIVIVAGYSNEMRRFVASNPGLASRFAKTIDFPPYRPSELLAIFRHIARERQYELPEAGLERLLQPWLADRMKSAEWGNARSIRNLFERVCEVQANRLAASADFGHAIQKISLGDVESALAKL